MRDDLGDPLEIHPRLAGVQVGKGCDLQRKIRRPLRRLQVVAGDAQAARLDAGAIGRGRSAEHAGAGGNLKKLTT